MKSDGIIKKNKTNPISKIVLQILFMQVNQV